MDDNLHKQMIFEESRKSVGIAYLLWLFVGLFGGHRFYAGRTKTGVAQIILLLIPILGWAILAAWLLADLFLIPGMIHERNMEIINLINHGDPKGERAPRGSGRAVDEDPRPAPIDRRREAMLEDLRQTGYRKKRRDPIDIYR